MSERRRVHDGPAPSGAQGLDQWRTGMEPESGFRAQVASPRDSLTIPTPPAIDLVETQRAIATARIAAERRTLTLLTGPTAGQIFVVSLAQHVLGRGELADIQIPDPDVSRRHARITRGEGGRCVVEDLGSTNGTFVGGDRIDAPRTIDAGARLQLGPHCVLRFAITDDVEEELQRRMYESNARDLLTRTFNRRYLGERLASEIAHARRHSAPLSVILFDVDGMKEVNGAHGYFVGDVLLRAIAARVHRLIRTEDVLARYGGDELVLLTRMTSHDAAAILAERVRVAIADLEIPTGDTLPGDGRDTTCVRVTASFGIASLSEVTEQPERELLRIAEARLARAKARGKNCVEKSPPQGGANR